MDCIILRFLLKGSYKSCMIYVAIFRDRPHGHKLKLLYRFYIDCIHRYTVEIRLNTLIN